jgi:hypothetical protein
MPPVVAVLLALVLTCLGTLALVGGQADDSPGLGGIGLVLGATAVWLAVRAVRRA